MNVSKVYIVFGVSGCGKSTIGKLLSRKLEISHYDADDFHPQANVDKMSSGRPLNDEDRLPWLLNLSEQIDKWSLNGGAVLSCSALKEKYRQILSSKTNTIEWIHLKGPKELIEQRMEARKDHYFSAAMLDSQISDLEEPEYGIKINVALDPEEIIKQIEKDLIHG